MGAPDRHPEGVARLAAVQLHHLPRVLGRHGAFRRSKRADASSPGNLLNGVPDLPLAHRSSAQLSQPLQNVYAEIGTTFAYNVVTFPTVCAHMLGQLLKYFGEDRIVFGSDSRLVRLAAVADRGALALPDSRGRCAAATAIPSSRQRPSARSSGSIPRGSTSCRRRAQSRPTARASTSRCPANYENRIPVPLKSLLEYPGLPQDKLAMARREYLAAGAMPSHTRYGWVHMG